MDVRVSVKNKKGIKLESFNLVVHCDLGPLGLGYHPILVTISTPRVGSHTSCVPGTRVKKPEIERTPMVRWLTK